jgi:hypothetical protein
MPEDRKRALRERDAEARATERSEMQSLCHQFLSFIQKRGVSVPVEQQAELIKAFVDERWPPPDDP